MKILHYALIQLYVHDEEKRKAVEFSTKRAQKIEDNPGWLREE
jgi:hypothetical protein